MSLIKEHRIYIEKNIYENQLYLTSKYVINTIFGDVDKKLTVPIRLWSKGDKSGKVLDTSETSIWDKDNFERGQMLRRRFGGNLPFGFPVLSGYHNGNAMIIKSMDLNKKTWEYSINVFEELKYDVNELYNYAGTNGAWGKNDITINTWDIKNRYIKFIFPENINYDYYNGVFEEIKNYGNSLDIIVEIINYQNS